MKRRVETERKEEQGYTAVCCKRDVRNYHRVNGEKIEEGSNDVLMIFTPNRLL